MPFLILGQKNHFYASIELWADLDRAGKSPMLFQTQLPLGRTHRSVQGGNKEKLQQSLSFKRESLVSPFMWTYNQVN